MEEPSHPFKQPSLLLCLDLHNVANGHNIAPGSDWGGTPAGHKSFVSITIASLAKLLMTFSDLEMDRMDGRVRWDTEQLLV